MVLKSAWFICETLTRTSRKSKTIKHEGHEGAQRKTLKALPSCYFVPFVVKFSCFLPALVAVGQGARISLFSN